MSIKIHQRQKHLSLGVVGKEENPSVVVGLLSSGAPITIAVRLPWFLIAAPLAYSAFLPRLCHSHLLDAKSPLLRVRAGFPSIPAALELHSRPPRLMCCKLHRSTGSFVRSCLTRSAPLTLSLGFCKRCFDRSQLTVAVFPQHGRESNICCYRWSVVPPYNTGTLLKVARV